MIHVGTGNGTLVIDIRTTLKCSHCRKGPDIKPIVHYSKGSNYVVHKSAIHGYLIRGRPLDFQEGLELFLNK